MRPRLLRRGVLALAALALAAPVVGGAAEPDRKVRKAKDRPFAERLAANEVIWTDAPTEPFDEKVHLAGVQVYRDPLAEQAARDILTKLIAVHEEPKPAVLPFFLTDSSEVNCSTLKTGGAILCTRGAVEQFYSANQAGKDQFAFLLAHELAHLTISSHRDRFGKTDKVKKDVLTAMTYAALIGMSAFSKWSKAGNQLTMTATAGSQDIFWTTMVSGMQVSEAAGGISGPAWARADEDDADAYALILMRRAGFEPDQGPQFLNTVDRSLRASKQRTTRLGAILRGGIDAGVTQGILTKGGIAGTAISAVSGMMRGAMEEGALAHYHRSPDKRAEACSRINGEQAVVKRAVDEEAQLRAQASGTPGPGAPVLQLAGPPGGGEAALRTAAAGARGPKGKGPRRPAAVRVAAAPAPPPPDSWTQFLRYPGPSVQLMLARQILDLLDTPDVPPATVELAAEKCPTAPTELRLITACAGAFAGLNDATMATPLLQQALRHPAADADTYTAVVNGHARLKRYDTALQVVDQGMQRYPNGELYPTDMLVRAGTGDFAGAERTAATCKEKAAQPIKIACARALAEVKAAAKKQVATAIARARRRA